MIDDPLWAAWKKEEDKNKAEAAKKEPIVNKPGSIQAMVSNVGPMGDITIAFTESIIIADPPKKDPKPIRENKVRFLQGLDFVNSTFLDIELEPSLYNFDNLTT